METVASRLAGFKNKISAYGNIRLIAVSKRQPNERLREALNAGHFDLGENIAQDLRDKANLFKDEPVNWHFIGHLQKNKIKYVVPNATLIHSVDNLKLAEAINNHVAQKTALSGIEILLQIKTAAEDTKYGLAPDALLDAITEWQQFSHLRIRGLMTMATNTDDKQTIRGCFKLARQTFESLQHTNTDAFRMQWLSMGMSNDYEIALDEGANMIRVGSAIFGPRT
jgi:pyridoxal phosphate enzyme (YggS family)